MQQPNVRNVTEPLSRGVFVSSVSDVIHPTDAPAPSDSEVLRQSILFDIRYLSALEGTATVKRWIKREFIQPVF